MIVDFFGTRQGCPPDPGGLLISEAPKTTPDLLVALKEAGAEKAAAIGQVVEEPAGKILVK